VNLTQKCSTFASATKIRVLSYLLALYVSVTSSKKYVFYLKYYIFLQLETMSFSYKVTN